MHILDRFTNHLRHSLGKAIDISWERQIELVSPLFLLSALSHEEGSIAAEILKECTLDPSFFDTILPEPSAFTGSNDGALHWPELSQDSKDYLKRAATFALEFEHQYVGTEHVLLAMIEEPDQTIEQILEDRSVSRDRIIDQLMQVMSGTARFGDVTALLGDNNAPTTIKAGTRGGQETAHTDTPALDAFGTDLTARSYQAKLDPVVGRDAEIERVIHILARRTKNNPILVGEPGVGKTAIVEGLARRIAQDDVPESLQSKRIVRLDLAAILAGSMYRGEFENRIRQILQEVESDSDCIVFIDEIHMLVGAGSVQHGNMDAANLIKPALAKGQLRCIGATTTDEYRKFVQADGALERRFQAVQVAAPTVDEAIDIVDGIKAFYERFHQVDIPSPVVETAVRWADRYVSNSQLPDKAFDVLDEAAAAVRTAAGGPRSKRLLSKSKRLLREIEKKKRQAVRGELYTEALELREQYNEVVETITELEAAARVEQVPPITLTETDIAKAIHKRTGVPVDHITANGKAGIKQVSTILEDRVVGQTAAVHAVLNVLKRSYAGIQPTERPLGTFLFLGPSGVGKTELAKALAEANFGSSDNLIRIDMSEFTESFTLSKLIGSPAGYVGYNDRNQLSDRLQQHPYSVVLFDEIEKAHPDVYQLLLQVFDEGYMTDNTGRRLDFRHSIVILTSNIGLDVFTQQAELGFATGKAATPDFATVADQVVGQLSDYFAPEFLQRIDHKLVFTPLDEPAMEAIVRKQFAHFAARTAERGVSVRLLKSAAAVIAEASYDAKNGARAVRQTIAELIETPLADMLLSGRAKAGDSVTVSAKSGKIVLQKRARKK